MALTDAQLDSALANLSAPVAEAVRAAVTHATFSGQLDGVARADAASLLPLAECYSVNPISDFSVGAVAVGQSGKLYLGANLEFQAMPLNATLHAEQSAVLNAWMHDESEIVALYISETPCGHCRQFLRELSNLDTLQIFVGDHELTLDELLPHAFGECRARGHGLLDSRPVALDVARPAPDTSKQRAIDAAQRSYVPYSHSPEGFVVECVNGRSFAGRAAESVAFNPSVTGVLAALNQRNLSSSRKVAIRSCTQAKLATAINNPLTFARSVLSSHSEVGIDVVHMNA
jgi:cytidine deaminase